MSGKTQSVFDCALGLDSPTRKIRARIARIFVIIVSSAGKNPFDPRGASDLEWGSGLHRTWRALAPRDV